MNHRKWAFSIAAGAIITVGLIVGLKQGPSLAMPSPSILQTTPDEDDTTLSAHDTVSSAHVVVKLGTNDTIVRQITFTTPISGLAALQLTGLDITVSEAGQVCAIEGVGCPASDPFCACPPPYDPCLFWNYLYWAEDSWASYGVGPAESTVEAGDVEGYAWGGFGTVPPSAPALVSAHRGLEWLRNQQQVDGSFGSLNDTVEVLMAVGANRMDASVWRRDGPSLLANAISRGTEFAERNAGGVGKLAAALAAQESYWPVDALRPLDYYDPGSGTYGASTLYHAWAMLGTASLSEAVPVSATEALKDLQLPNGGWEWASLFGADTNDTALALQALVAAGEPVTSTSIISGLAYLESAQNVDGGFTYQPGSQYGTDSDTNSTAYVVQALLATGEDPSAGTWTISGTNPISYLLSMQLPDGSFEWQPGFGGNQYATQQAIPALLGRPVPILVTQVGPAYGIAGEVVSRVGATEKPSAGVWVEAEGANDIFFAVSDATGAYTISVPSAAGYQLAPFMEGFTFSPTVQTVEVSGVPGDVTTAPKFAGAARSYLPLIYRD